ncbi:MAG: Lrp/AsnC family transcriptional regulator [Candidatus Diapherotrites archaeon]
MDLKIDSKDLEIIECLKQDASRSVRQIANKTKIPITTVHHRIKSLKEKGVIEKTTIKLDPEKMGLELSAYVLITAFSSFTSGEKVSQKKICKELSKFSGIELIDIVTGETDIIIKVRVKNIKELNKLILDKIREIPGVDKTNTFTVLEEIKID